LFRETTSLAPYVSFAPVSAVGMDMGRFRLKQSQTVSAVGAIQNTVNNLRRNNDDLLVGFLVGSLVNFPVKH